MPAEEASFLAFCTNLAFKIAIICTFIEVWYTELGDKKRKQTAVYLIALSKNCNIWE